MFYPAFGQDAPLDSVANVADSACGSIFKKHNPYGKGTIFDADSNKISAIVGLSLFGEKQEDGTVIESETPVKLYCLADEKLIRSFELKDVRKVIVNHTVYIPITILSSTRLMELVYEKDDFQLFYEAAKSDYFIRFNKMDSAYYENATYEDEIQFSEDFDNKFPSLKDKHLQVVDVSDEHLLIAFSDEVDAAGLFQSMKGFIFWIENTYKRK
jgi:hypothetical protein